MLGNKDFKLAVDISSANFKQNILYWGAWVLDALGSFMFGVVFNTMLFMTILNLTPFAPETQMLIASVLGGLATFFVTNVVFVLWRNAYMNADSVNQMRIGVGMTFFTFFMSICFTAVSFSLLGFPHLFTAGTLSSMETFGALGFILLVIAHLSAAMFYRESAPSVTAKRKTVKLNTKTRAEQDRLIEEVTTDGITNGSAQALQDSQVYRELYARQFGANLLAAVSDTMPSTQQVLPAPTTKPRREEARPGNQGTIIDAARNKYFVKQGGDISLAVFETVHKAIAEIVESGDPGQVVDAEGRVLYDIPASAQSADVATREARNKRRREALQNNAPPTPAFAADSPPMPMEVEPTEADPLA